MTQYVATFLFDHYRDVLLVEKKYGPEINIGKWNAVGGKVSDGETPEAAAMRELAEETGIEMEIVSSDLFSILYVNKPHSTDIVHFYALRSSLMSHQLSTLETNDVGERLMWMTRPADWKLAYNLTWLLPMAEFKVRCPSRGFVSSQQEYIGNQKS